MPKIKFIVNPIACSESILSLLDSGFEGETKKAILNDHPKLKGVLDEKNSESEKEIVSYVVEFFERNKKEIEDGKQRIEKEWRKIENDVFSELSKLLNTDWKGLEEITCNVSIFQMFPRDLEKKSFDVYFEEYKERTMATILHEVTHFIYFKKWNELFPEDREDSFEYPHKYWYLSEVMAPIINSEKDLVKLIPDAVVGAEDETSLSFFKKKYYEFKKSGKSMEDFLKYVRNNFTHS